MNNLTFKELLKRNRIYQWEVAHEVGVSEITLCRWLRQEIPEEKYLNLISAVKNILAKRADA